MKKLIALAASTAMLASALPSSASAEQVDRSTTNVGDQGQTIETIQVRQGGFVAPSNTMGAMVLCSPGAGCVPLYASGNNGPSFVAQVWPGVSHVWAADVLRPPTYNNQEGDVNVSNGSSSQAVQSQNQTANTNVSNDTDVITIADANATSNPVVISNSEGGDATSNPFIITSAEGGNATNVNTPSTTNVNTAFGGNGGEGGDGGNGFGLGLGFGGSSSSNSTNTNTNTFSNEGGGNGGGNGNCGNQEGSGGGNGGGNSCDD